MDRKSTANAQAQANNQAAINHQMHLSTIQVLTGLYQHLTTESSYLRGPLEKALVSLVEPFGPPTVPQASSNLIS